MLLLLAAAPVVVAVHIHLPVVVAVLEDHILRNDFCNPWTNNCVILLALVALVAQVAL